MPPPAWGPQTTISKFRKFPRTLRVPFGTLLGPLIIRPKKTSGHRRIQDLFFMVLTSHPLAPSSHCKKDRFSVLFIKKFETANWLYGQGIGMIVIPLNMRFEAYQ